MRTTLKSNLYATNIDSQGCGRAHYGHGAHLTGVRYAGSSGLRPARRHRSAADIHDLIVGRAPAVTLSTVYRTLSTLTEHGLVHTLTRGGEVHYGFADAPHHHGVCTGCGTTTEIPAEMVADLVDRLQRAAGLTLAPDGITLAGLCPACAAPPRL